jgi:hypothetical protein
MTNCVLFDHHTRANEPGQAEEDATGQGGSGGRNQVRTSRTPRTGSGQASPAGPDPKPGIRRAGISRRWCPGSASPPESREEHSIRARRRTWDGSAGSRESAERTLALDRVIRAGPLSSTRDPQAIEPGCHSAPTFGPPGLARILHARRRIGTAVGSRLGMTQPKAFRFLRSGPEYPRDRAHRIRNPDSAVPRDRAP